MPFQQLLTGTGLPALRADLDFEDPKYGHVCIIGWSPSASLRAKVS